MKKGVRDIGRVKKRAYRGSHENHQGGKNARTKGQWEKWWWRVKNKLCLKCTGECKQSQYAKVIICPQYKEIK